MDPRSAAHALRRIAALLELAGENRFKARAYTQAAHAVAALDTDDLTPLVRSGALEEVPGLGPATLAVLRDLATTGESSLLARLQAETPEGLVAMLRVPGLGPPKIRAIHDTLGITSLAELEDAARDGRLATVKGIGAKTAAKLAEAVAFARAASGRSLYHRAAMEAAHVIAEMRRHPAIVDVAVAGALRRRCETIGVLDVVAAVREDPTTVAASLAQAPGVRSATSAEHGGVRLEYVDGTRVDLRCATPSGFAIALWRATGNATHVREVEARLVARGVTLSDDGAGDATARRTTIANEAELYALAGLACVPPELREGDGEVDAAARDALPSLLVPNDLCGVLHCHSTYSDGGATIAEMAEAARVRGWSYIGVTDHSQNASYAGGMRPADVRRQHDEIDALNAAFVRDGVAFRILKGIEADILDDGRVDYGKATLELFDYVISSVHSRFAMTEAQMTDRVCRAMNDPHLTILGHPTGRLLLGRAGYAIDLDTIIAHAAETGVAIELNADPHRLDLDWRYLRRAKERGVTIEIGPDAHSTQGLDNVHVGVGVARKGWLEARDVLNARDADGVLAFARARRA